jgi:hypothetical protein
MVRITCGAVLAGLVTTLPAQAEGRWVEAVDNGNIAVYVDSKTVRSTGSTHRIWYHMEFQGVDSDGDYGLSSYEIADCAEGTMRTLELAAYDQPNRGHVRKRVNGDNKPSTPLPDTIEEDLLQFVCDLTSRKPWATYRLRRVETPPPDGNVE